MLITKLTTLVQQKNCAHVDFNDKKLDNIGFIKLNGYQAKGQLATAKCSADQSIDEHTLVRKSQNIDFTNHTLGNISQITLNSEPTDDNHIATNSYVDSLSEKERNRRSQEYSTKK